MAVKQGEKQRGVVNSLRIKVTSVRFQPRSIRLAIDHGILSQSSESPYL